jgi:hypothetical protein
MCWKLPKRLHRITNYEDAKKQEDDAKAALDLGHSTGSGRGEAAWGRFYFVCYIRRRTRVQVPLPSLRGPTWVVPHTAWFRCKTKHRCRARIRVSYISLLRRWPNVGPNLSSIQYPTLFKELDNPLKMSCPVQGSYPSLCLLVSIIIVTYIEWIRRYSIILMDVQKI